MSNAATPPNPLRPSNVENPIVPAFQFGEVNASLRVYKGEVEVSQNALQFRAPVDVSLSWLPSPAFRFAISSLAADKRPEIVESLCLRLDDGTEIRHAFATQMANAWGLPGFECNLSGVIGGRVDLAPNGLATFVLFMVPNFEDVLGDALALPSGGWRRGRLKLLGGEWQITLDNRPDLRDVIQSLGSGSGFALSHVGRLERIDHGPFDAKAAWGVLEALGWYLSFCAGRWVGPCVPRGYTAADALSWESWGCLRTAPYQVRPTWADTLHKEHYQTPFAGFMRLWGDESWREVIHTAIHWYVESNACAGSIEGSIVLTQTAFELLSSFVLVEREGWVSDDPFKKLPAADRIRMLLKWAGLPTEVPESLAELTKLARGIEAFKLNKRPDSAAAMTTLRNTITHPTRENRKKFGGHADARREVWSLGLWALELCLLRMFEHRGTYANRLTQGYRGEVEALPWTPSVPQSG